MHTFLLNGVPTTASEDCNLLEYLRDKCRLTSVKNGCAKGVCGTCTILLDRKAVKACTHTLSKVAGKSVTTLEGVSPRERDIYASAFAAAGAVQCGFCTPGMILCAKALLDATPQPTPRDVKKAIRNNLCRCTGYVKIEKAILLAADVLAGRARLPEAAIAVGQPFARIDAYAKAAGTAEYCDDVFLDGMIYGKVLRSPYPRARLVRLDVEKARSLPGVEAVLTWKDIPGNNIDGYLVKDVPTLVPAGECTRCVGDAVALIGAADQRIAEEAARLIEAEYEVLEPVVDPVEAMKEGAPPIHEKGNILSHTHICCGEPAKAMEESRHVIRNTFALPGTDQAFLEPESSVAFYEGDVLTVYSTSQSVYHDLHSLCNILGLPESKVRVKSKYVGGAFGGKEDLHVQQYAALLAYATGKPSKLTVSREESMLFHPKRHPMRIEYELGCDAEGNFTAVRAAIVADTGAYASLGPAVVLRACTHICGPYRVPNFEVDGYTVYTNNPPYGAFRGFGVTQVNFAQEVSIDVMAKKLGKDRFDLRWQNALAPGDTMATGQLCQEDTAIRETLRAVEAEYRACLAANRHVGIACAIKNVGLGGGLTDTGRVRIKIENGTVALYTGAQCLGQGLATVMLQIAAEELGLPAERFRMYGPDTFTTPDSGAATASRHTQITGEAVRLAARQMAAELEGHSLAELEGREYFAEYSPPTDPINAPGVEHPVSQISYGYATQLAVLDDAGKVEKILAAHDVGRSINPLNVEGQIEGGVVMGMGYALTENFVVEGGFVKSKFATLGLLRSTDVPSITPIIIETGRENCPSPAKGVGEITTIPTAAAIANAYASRNGTVQLSLPLQDTPYARPARNPMNSSAGVRSQDLLHDFALKP